MSLADDMSAYRDVFLSESAEFLQAITDGLIALEADPGETAQLEVVFRGAHSLKGMSAAMGYDRTAELTHRMEGLLDLVRKGELGVDGGLVDLLLRATDVVRELLGGESGEGSGIDTTGVLAEIEEAVAAPRPAPDAVSAGEPDGDTKERLVRVRVRIEQACVLKSVRAYMVVKRLGELGEVLDTVPPAWELEDEAFDRDFEALVRTDREPSVLRDAVATITEVETATAFEERRKAEQTPRSRDHAPLPKLSETQTVRVSIGHLDTMVDLVGELVILRSRLEGLAGRLSSVELERAVEDLERVSGELQHEVMQTRMVPVGNIFNRFPRMVRDLSRDLGKQVAFEMDGLDIELDRTVLDEIGDTIVHLLRNAVDHGIESESVRATTGKPQRGMIRLLAERERDQVRISVADDGRGIDVERVWSKALEKGIVDASQRETMSDSDVLMLTATPGFSTIDVATAVSGRGVGMDVVKEKIEQLGGTIAVHSHLGLGTEFVMSLPLTLAIIQSLLVGCQGRTYALPLGSVSEVLDPGESRTETLDGSPVLVLRDGEVVPVLCLAEALHDTVSDSPGHIVLLHVAEGLRALRVERLLGRQEIVIKPLSPLFRDARGIGGATVLGDGRVALILDPRTLFAA